MIRYWLVFFLLQPIFRLPTPTTEITIHLENVRSNEGYILLGIYRDQETWSKRTPLKEYHIAKTNIIGGKLTLDLSSFEPGVYGIAFLDDENGNQIVDMGIIFPKEGFGFSNYYHSSFLPPRFKDFTFNYPGKKDVRVRFRYLRNN